MKKETEQLKHALVARLKKVLGENATKQLVESCQPELLKRLKPGQTMPTVAELLVDKIVTFALDKTKANQWAVDLVFSYIEGRPVQGLPKRDDGKHVEEQLDDITKQHLNILAASITGNARKEPASIESQDRTPGPASKLVGLSNYRIGGSQNSGKESNLEIATAAVGI